MFHNQVICYFKLEELILFPLFALLLLCIRPADFWVKMLKINTRLWDKGYYTWAALVHNTPSMTSISCCPL